MNKWNGTEYISNVVYVWNKIRTRIVTKQGRYDLWNWDERSEYLSECNEDKDDIIYEELD